jgi:hypothetical protein
MSRLFGPSKLRSGRARPIGQQAWKSSLRDVLRAWLGHLYAAGATAAGGGLRQVRGTEEAERRPAPDSGPSKLRQRMTSGAERYPFMDEFDA